MQKPLLPVQGWMGGKKLNLWQGPRGGVLTAALRSTHLRMIASCVGTWWRRRWSRPSRRTSSCTGHPPRPLLLLLLLAQTAEEMCNFHHHDEVGAPTPLRSPQSGAVRREVRAPCLAFGEAVFEGYEPLVRVTPNARVLVLIPLATSSGINRRREVFRGLFYTFFYWLCRASWQPTLPAARFEAQHIYAIIASATCRCVCVESVPEANTPPHGRGREAGRIWKVFTWVRGAVVQTNYN